MDFPGTVFPPADNSPPPSGPFKSRHTRIAVAARRRVAATAKETVRLDRFEASLLAWRVDSDDVSVRRQQMKEAF